jgi:hypothetical protein
MSSIDLSFLQDDPSEKTATSVLCIEPLGPLSMNTSVPGRHYQTATHPPDRQIYGLLENAMGLHFGWGDDYEVRQMLADAAAAEVDVSFRNKRDFQPLIGEYVTLERTQAPETKTYDDLQWAHKWRDSATVRAGAMHHDWRAMGDDPSKYGYGKSLVSREHVVANGVWRYRLRATPATMEALRVALDDPAAPLYLGKNDGWVDAWVEEAA